MEGGFVAKVAPGVAVEEEAGPPPGILVTVVAELIDEMTNWPAQVSARIVARVAPKVPGRVVEVRRRVGDSVRRGEVVARLEGREFKARLEQAKARLAEAEAESTRARAEVVRTENLFAREAATRQALETAQAAARAAAAQVQAAREAVIEAESVFAEVELKSPVDGTVVARDLDVGDTALPGMSVITVQEGGRLRVEVAIGERCAGSLRVGGTLRALGGVPEREYPLVIEELAPAADPATRTVWLKAWLPEEAEWQPGMFVTVLHPCGSREVLLVPLAAVNRIGQIESVRTLSAGRVRLRHIRTGKSYGDRVEVLSGLRAGETVLIPDS
jgi:RND family efflux transporter MFP subunit